jgi:hypothetical protein
MLELAGLVVKLPTAIAVVLAVEAALAGMLAMAVKGQCLAARLELELAVLAVVGVTDLLLTQLRLPRVAVALEY